MKTIALLSLLASLTLTGSAAATSVDTPVMPQGLKESPLLSAAGEGPTIRPSIAGGKAVSLGTYPYAVRVQIKPSSRDPYQLLCSGALIAPRYVLTAAHCLQFSPLEFDETLPQSKMRVRFSNIAGAPAINVRRSAYWRDFNSLLVGSEPQSDVAILELASDAPTAAAELADSGPLGAVVTELGYGPTKKKEADGESPVLVAGEMKTVDSSVCAGRVEGIYIKTFSTTEICAKSEVPTLTAGACHGDSGGPLLEDGKIIGVTSWSKVENCNVSASLRQTVFSRLYPARDWLRQQTGAALFSLPAVERNIATPTGLKGRVYSINRSRAIFLIDASGSDWQSTATVAITALTRSGKRLVYSGIASLDAEQNGLRVNYPPSWRRLKLKKISADGYFRFYNRIGNGSTLITETRSVKVKR